MTNAHIPSSTTHATTIITATGTAVAASSSSSSSSSGAAPATVHVPGNLKVVGVILAIVSGVLIGSSFVFKKKGLLRSQANGVAGEGVAYLKSTLWWSGMIMMILGELCNFAAYAFTEAIVVTPLGALSVVISAVMSSIFLKEQLTFFGWLGCGLCILGSIVIALNSPESPAVGQIKDFQKLFLAPGFLAWAGILIIASGVVIFVFAPKYGKKSMLWYIFVCSMIGGISVSVTSGLGAAIVTTAYGDNQFKYWFTYFLLAFIIITLVTEVYYLNVALALFNTAMVTPTYYVIFTFFSIVTTIVLFQGLKAPARQIVTLVMGFLVICFGIVILQMSKIDPKQLGSTLDRRSTLLLQAARARTEALDEKNILAAEDPGIDTLRGSFGTVGSIIRARSARRMSMASEREGGGGGPGSRYRIRAVPPSTPGGGSYMTGMAVDGGSPFSGLQTHSLDMGDGSGTVGGLKRHQLYDSPVPMRASSSITSGLNNSDIHSTSSVMGSPSMAGSKRPTIKFGEEDVVHQYDRPGTGDRMTEHTRRAGGVGVGVVGEGYPPLPVHPTTHVGMVMDGLPVERPHGFAGVGAGGGGGGVSGSKVWGRRSVESLSPVEEGSSRSASGSGSGSGSGHGKDLSLGVTGGVAGGMNEELLLEGTTQAGDAATSSQSLLLDHKYPAAASSPPHHVSSGQSTPTAGSRRFRTGNHVGSTGRAGGSGSGSGSGSGGSWSRGRSGGGKGSVGRRADARAVFDLDLPDPHHQQSQNQPSPARSGTTLLSFPSLTDSGLSGGGGGGAGAGMLDDIPWESDLPTTAIPHDMHTSTNTYNNNNNSNNNTNTSSRRGIKNSQTHAAGGGGGGGGGGGKRPSSSHSLKRYPRGSNDDDDREESVSLWRRKSLTTDEETTTTTTTTASSSEVNSPLAASPDDHTGGGMIRLVTPPKSAY